MLNTMERAIVGTLLNWGPTQGWELWADDEGIAGQLKMPTHADTAGYKVYKRTLERLIVQGYIVRESEDRKLHKIVWRATEAGQAEWSRRVEQVQTEPPSEQASRYINKRIRGRKQIPREVWRELMEKVEAGELYFVFRVNDDDASKKTGGGKK